MFYIDVLTRFGLCFMCKAKQTSIQKLPGTGFSQLGLSLAALRMRLDHWSSGRFGPGRAKNKNLVDLEEKIPINVSVIIVITLMFSVSNHICAYLWYHKIKFIYLNSGICVCLQNIMIAEQHPFYKIIQKEQNTTSTKARKQKKTWPTSSSQTTKTIWKEQGV